MISIVIPAFNAENTLAETIDSALDSGLSTQQIILVDDGSEDSTWDLISKYSSKYKCIDKHHAQKSYVSPLYNKSLSKKKYLSQVNLIGKLSTVSMHSYIN